MAVENILPKIRMKTSFWTAIQRDLTIDISATTDHLASLCTPLKTTPIHSDNSPIDPPVKPKIPQWRQTDMTTSSLITTDFYCSGYYNCAPWTDKCDRNVHRRPALQQTLYHEAFPFGKLYDS